MLRRSFAKSSEGNAYYFQVYKLFQFKLWTFVSFCNKLHHLPLIYHGRTNQTPASTNSTNQEWTWELKLFMIGCIAFKGCRWACSSHQSSKLLSNIKEFCCNSSEAECFQKTNFEVKVTEILKIKLQYLKIQIPLKTKIVFFFFTEF